MLSLSGWRFRDIDDSQSHIFGSMHPTNFLLISPMFIYLQCNASKNYGCLKLDEIVMSKLQKMYVKCTANSKKRCLLKNPKP